MVTLEGEFCGSSFNILEIEGDSKCILPFFHTEEQVTYRSHSLHSCKTATLVSEFAVEDLLLGRTAALVPEFAVKDLPLGRTL